MRTGAAPIDCAETIVAQESVEETDPSAALCDVSELRRDRVAAGQKIADGNRMLAPHTNGECHIRADDVVVTVAIATADAAHEIFPPRRIKGGAIAKNEAQRQQGLRSEAKVIVIFRGAMHGAHRCVARTQGRTALQSDPLRQPCLRRSTKR